MSEVQPPAVPSLSRFFQQFSENAANLRLQSPLLDAIMNLAEQQAAVRERAQCEQVQARQEANGRHFRRVASCNRRGLRPGPPPHPGHEHSEGGEQGRGVEHGEGPA